VAREHTIGLLLGLALIGPACRTLERWIPEETIVAETPLSFDRDVDLLPPENLLIASNADRTIVLTWSPVLVGDVAGYVIMRALDTSGPFRLVGRTTSRFGTLFHDDGDEPGALGDGQTYFYRVHPFDVAGRVSRSHAFVKATTEAQPEPPASVIIYSNLPRKVVLSWQASARPSVTSYGIYRSPTRAGPYERVALVEGRLNTIHEDPVRGDLRVMYYRLTAVNRFGGESEMTPATRAVTKADPLPPVGLRAAERRIGEIELRWNPNVEQDLLAYEIWRSVREPEGWSDPTRLAEIPPDIEPLAYRDVGVGCGQQLRYSIRTRDRDGLISDWAPRLQVEGLGLGLHVASQEDGTPEIRWDASRTSGWPRARVELARGFGLPGRVLGWADPEPRFVLPPDLEGSFELRIILEGPADAAAPREAPACAIALVRDGDALALSAPTE
jgi:fibronectin type 3 domain-containing protein